MTRNAYKIYVWVMPPAQFAGKFSLHGMLQGIYRALKAHRIQVLPMWD